MAPVVGVNFCDWENRFGTESAHVALRHLKTLGVREVVLVPTWYQPKFDSTTIRRLAGKTPDDAGMIVDLRRAKSLGFSTGIKFHIDPEDGSARSNIRFRTAREFEAWWANYRAIALHYARMARDCGAEHYSVGCELGGVSIPPYTQHWRSLITEVRGLFGRAGPRITYSARHQDAPNIAFLGDLDYIGVNAWPYFTITNAVSVAHLRAAWRTSIHFPENFAAVRPAAPGQEAQTGYALDFFDYLRVLHRLYGKPIALTEMGCQSKEGVLSRPVDWWAPGTPDVLSQALFFQAFFEEVSADRAAWAATNPAAPYPLRSILVWNYMCKEGGPMDTDYTFRNKALTEQVIRRFTVGAAHGSSGSSAAGRVP